MKFQQFLYTQNNSCAHILSWDPPWRFTGIFTDSDKSDKISTEADQRWQNLSFNFFPIILKIKQLCHNNENKYSELGSSENDTSTKRLFSGWSTGHCGNNWHSGGPVRNSPNEVVTPSQSQTSRPDHSEHVPRCAGWSHQTKWPNQLWLQ